MECLARCENSIDLSHSEALDWVQSEDDQEELPLHRSHRIHQLRQSIPSWLWGKTVEHIWNIVMANGTTTDKKEWRQLSSRLLVWRTMDSKSIPGEWARRVALDCVGDELSC